MSGTKIDDRRRSIRLSRDLSDDDLDSSENFETPSSSSSGSDSDSNILFSPDKSKISLAPVNPFYFPSKNMSKITVASSSVDSEDLGQFRSGEKYEINEARVARLKKKKYGIDVYPVSYSHPACIYLATAVSCALWFSHGWFWINLSYHDTIILPRKTKIDFALQNNLLLGTNFYYVLLTCGVIHKICGGLVGIVVGSKYILFVALFTNILSGLVMAFNKLQPATIIMGMSYAIGLPAAVIYVVECSPPGLRATFISAIFVSYSMGRFLCTVIWYWMARYKLFNYWLLIPASVGIFSCIPAVILYTLPKSPAYLVSIGEDLEAEESLICLRRVPFVLDRLALIQHQVSGQRTSVHSHRVTRMLLVGHVRNALLLCAILVVLRTLSESQNVQAEVFHLWKNSDDTPLQANVKMEGLILAFSLGALYTNEYLGNRTCLIAGYLFTFFSHILAHASLIIKEMQSSPTSILFSNSETADNCSHFISCVDCLDGDKCGFCYKLTETKQVVQAFCTSIQNRNLSARYSSTCNIDNPNHLIDTTECPQTSDPLLFKIILIINLIAYLFGKHGITLAHVAVITPQWARNFSFVFIFFLDDLSLWFHTIDYIADTSKYMQHAAFALMAIFFTYFFIDETRGRPLEYCDTLPMWRKPRIQEVIRRDKIVFNRLKVKGE